MRNVIICGSKIAPRVASDPMGVSSLEGSRTRLEELRCGERLLPLRRSHKHMLIKC